MTKPRYDNIDTTPPNNQFTKLSITLPLSQFNWASEMAKFSVTVEDADIADIWTPMQDIPHIIDREILIPSSKILRPRILVCDQDFERNTRIILNSLNNIHATYFIANCGIPHLFGIAKALRERGIEVGFYLPQLLRPQNKSSYSLNIRTAAEALRYYTDEFYNAKQTPPIDSISTMIDGHRADKYNWNNPYKLDTSAFVSIETLHELGIQRVVILGESYETKEGEIRPEEDDLVNILQSYQKAGLEVFVTRVDSRDEINRDVIRNPFTQQRDSNFDT